MCVCVCVCWCVCVCVTLPFFLSPDKQKQVWDGMTANQTQHEHSRDLGTGIIYSNMGIELVVSDTLAFYPTLGVVSQKQV